MNQDIAQRVVLITGASSGIGEALAREFASRGAYLVLTARRKDRIEELARELTAKGTQAIAVAADVTVDGDMESAVALGLEAFGRIDVVIANAGFGVSSELAKLTLDDYRRQFETNVFGVLRTVYASVNALAETRGRLALVGSVSGYLSLPAGSAYAMSKYAVRALAEGLRGELAEKGVSVTHIAPGFVDSEIRRVSNEGEFQAERTDFIPSWLRMPADKAARQMADAVLARRREVIVTLHGKLAVRLAQHFPGLVAVVGDVIGRAAAKRSPKTRR